jgi:cation-transporting ATPase 13A1
MLHCLLTYCSRADKVDLEAEFEPSLLNSAIYLLQLIQQVSTFAINYQGRPFRESLSENRYMFYGIVGVSGLAFACAMELVPDINEGMKLVPFSSEFKIKMTVCMFLDYVVCWVIEFGLKRTFSDFRGRDISDRRPEQLQREEARKEVVAQGKAVEDAKKADEKKIEWERQVEERRQKLRNWQEGRQRR